MEKKYNYNKSKVTIVNVVGECWQYSVLIVICCKFVGKPDNSWCYGSGSGGV